MHNKHAYLSNSPSMIMAFPVPKETKQKCKPLLAEIIPNNANPQETKISKHHHRVDEEKKATCTYKHVHVLHPIDLMNVRIPWVSRKQHMP